MRIVPFRREDIAPFLSLASAENWVADPWEFEFLLSEFSRGCFTACGADGVPAGFVTSLLHDRSGWVGNLIVSAEYRGQGVGEDLFVSALESLRAAGVETVWLTASKSGQALYEKHGFTSIDTVVRWVGKGRQRHAAHGAASERDGLKSSSHDFDNQAWDDRRATLLAATAHRGELLQTESGFIVRQPCADAVQFGPYAALNGSAAERLFDAAARTVALGTKIFLDAPVANRAALRLFNRKKMRIAGSNVLMYAGKKPDYRPELIFGLATMGSCG